jgi:hypothetical protein
MRLEPGRREALAEAGEHRGDVHQFPHGLLDGGRDWCPGRATRGLDGHDRPE